MVGEIERTRHFKKQYRRLDPAVQKRFKKALANFVENEAYPSLRVKRMTHVANVWEARIDGQFRFTFSRTINGIILRAIGTHEIYKNP